MSFDFPGGARIPVLSPFKIRAYLIPTILTIFIALLHGILADGINHLVIERKLNKGFIYKYMNKFVFRISFFFTWPLFVHVWANFFIFDHYVHMFMYYKQLFTQPLQLAAMGLI